jgi:hypothetical protein
LHSCRARSSQRSLILQHDHPKNQCELPASYSFEATYG